MPSAGALSWLEDPLAQPLMEFNFLPARLCHPDHEAPGWRMFMREIEGLGSDRGASLRELRRANRLASGAMLPGLQDEGVVDLDDPTLPLFMAPGETFERLVLHLGLVPIGPLVRQVISRDEVRALEAAFGAEALTFARRTAARWWTVGAGSAMALESYPRAQALLLGAGVLFSVARQATPPVARRALLRLPAAAQDACARLPAPFREGPMALDMAVFILHQLYPQWIALFPARP